MLRCLLPGILLIACAGSRAHRSALLTTPRRKETYTAKACLFVCGFFFSLQTHAFSLVRVSIYLDIQFAPFAVTLPANEREKINAFIDPLRHKNCDFNAGIAIGSASISEGPPLERERLASARAAYVVQLLKRYDAPKGHMFVTTRQSPGIVPKVELELEGLSPGCGIEAGDVEEQK